MSLRPLTLVGIVISMVTGIALGIMAYRSWLEHEVRGSHARAIDEVLDRVESSYVTDVDRDELVANALRGILDNLDEHSLYLDPGAYHELQAETSGRFGGIGVELGMVDDYFTIIAPMDDTPAAQAGLRSGDRLIEVDGESLRGQRLLEVIGRLRGEPGSAVSVRISRDGTPRDFTVTRALIETDSVASRLLEPGLGYVRISQFQIGTGPAFEAAIDDLAERSGGRLNGLVLDLRDNPGGVLQSSVAVADALLEQGMIVYTEGRRPSSRHTYRATTGDALSDAPVVVLVNGGSASAAEIVAGALQDHRRAIVMGTRSYGKGSVQSVLPVTGDQAIKLTTAYYYTPNGRSIHHAGIEPDVERARSDESDDEFDTRLLNDALGLLKEQSGERLQARAR